MVRPDVRPAKRPTVMPIDRASFRVTADVEAVFVSNIRV